MRGAVLYKLGLNFVKERLMRRSYGACVQVLFSSGYHPEHLKVECIDGVIRCDRVMDWFVQKVPSPVILDI